MPKALTLAEKVERAEATRTERTPTRRKAFNGTEGKLIVNGNIDGYHLHILNDSPGRIDQALQSGYEFVLQEEIDGVGMNVVSRNTDIGDKVRFLVGHAEDGGPLYAYLMKIKQEWYEEDQREAESRNQRIDEAIRKGKTPGVDSQGFYTPKEGIKISRS